MKTFFGKFLFAGLAVVFLSSAAFGAIGERLDRADGRIVVVGQSAYVEMNGILFGIEKENAAYVQFEGRHVRMYSIRIEKDGPVRRIDFKKFRLIDALV